VGAIEALKEMGDLRGPREMLHISLGWIKRAESLRNGGKTFLG